MYNEEYNEIIFFMKKLSKEENFIFLYNDKKRILEFYLKEFIGNRKEFINDFIDFIFKKVVYNCDALSIEKVRKFSKKLISKGNVMNKFKRLNMELEVNELGIDILFNEKLKLENKAKEFCAFYKEKFDFASLEYQNKIFNVEVDMFNGAISIGLNEKDDYVIMSIDEKELAYLDEFLSILNEDTGIKRINYVK